MRADHSAEPDPRGWPVGWIAGFVTALTAVWITLVFGLEIGEWWAHIAATITTPGDFRAWVEGLGAWGPVAFFLAQALQVILVPIPGALFSPVGSLAFGPWPALGLSLAGMAIGSAMVFLVARKWGRPLAVRLVGADLIHRYERVMTANGALVVWLVFVLPLLPDDALCALAGLSGIGFSRFMVIAVVGRAPGVAMGVFTMAGLEGAPPWVWALASCLAVVALWAGLRYRGALEAMVFRVMGKFGRSGSGASVTALSRPVIANSAQVDTREPPATISRRDPLSLVLTAVVVTTSIAVLIGVAAGVSGLASGIILVWGAALAVMVSWSRTE